MRAAGPRAPLRLRASRLIALGLAPVLFVQAKALRRATPRLPEASGARSGSIAGTSGPVRLLVAGDSTAVGVGVDTIDDSLGVALARELHERTGRGVAWRVLGRSGISAGGFTDGWLEEALAEPADLVFVSLGANDALKVRSAVRFVRDLSRILGELHERNPGASVVVSSLPAFHRFAGLREPLRSTLYRHAQALEAAARANLDPVEWASMSPPPPPYGADFFASDRFHPGVAGYRDWARWALDAAPAAWR